MKRGCDIPLDSYRLAQYALQVPCYICDGPNSAGATSFASQPYASDARPHLATAGAYTV